ncbi:hypothetical protein GO730_20365 [Spirosoma sp. HMF3257]|uniref:hypothetical protein n=1 Tax=Spirosoma telluris TaxID=2183553 RepID=UPI0011B94309|nr:hypothetical protein [Spirosoma telluris]
MKPGNYLILLIVLLPTLCSAQLKIFGLGRYRIEVTTPDSLPSDFSEDEPSYVKGTIALPCTHIRTFSSLTTEVAGVSVVNLCLAFYDNKLFKITCDYSAKLEEVFSRTYGKGVAEPTRRFSFCDKNRPMLLWGKAGKLAIRSPMLSIPEAIRPTVRCRKQIDSL